MKVVFETNDVREWWKAKNALKSHHIVVHDCRVTEGNNLLLEVRDQDQYKATLIIKRKVKT